MSDDPQKVSSVEEQGVIGGGKVAPETKSEREKRQASADFNRTEDSGKPGMRAKVYSPFKDYYDGPALSVSAVNATGPFDILPRHHNFISLLSPCELVVRRTKEDERKIIISGGVMHVKADQIIVFLDV